jgi:hypothetical protein
MKSIIKKYVILFIDIFFSPLTFISTIWLKFVRLRIVGLWENYGFISKHIFLKIGVFPILDDFYEPKFFYNNLIDKSRINRNLPGIKFDLDSYKDILSKLHYGHELIELSKLPDTWFNYNFNRGSFLSGDSEILYSFIRYFKPNKIIEIGCGQSSLMIQHAINFNSKESNQDIARHICIEPFANKYLRKLNLEFIESKVEDVSLDLFKTLDENDILFIDSSHIIRPNGDVLFEYLEILPLLKKGVYVHIHDIFTPKNYLNQWTHNGINFWNEQYMLEAFLSNNSDFKIVLPLNLVKHELFDELKDKCPMLNADREPGSFWIKRV